MHWILVLSAKSGEYPTFEVDIQENSQDLPPWSGENALEIKHLMGHATSLMW